MQRRHIWRFALLGIIALSCTLLGIILAFANNIEEPPHDGALLAIGTVALCNLLWFVPWTIVQLRRGDKNKIMAGVVLFLLCWTHFPYRYFHHPGFDPEVWKSSTDTNYSYAGLCPAHRAGYMVPDIIASGVCEGKRLDEIEQLLGPEHFPLEYTGHRMNETAIAYLYSNGVLFDGCNKLILYFEEGFCVKAGYGGCD